MQMSHICSSMLFFLFQWLPLEDVKSGRLHVKLECLPPIPSAAELEQVMGSSQESCCVG